MKLIEKYNDYKLQIVISKVIKSDEKKARTYKNRNTYVNPCALKLK